MGAARDGPVCGSDGNVYANTCELKKTTCGQDVVVVANRNVVIQYKQRLLKAPRPPVTVRYTGSF